MGLSRVKWCQFLITVTCTITPVLSTMWKLIILMNAKHHERCRHLEVASSNPFLVIIGFNSYFVYLSYNTFFLTLWVFINACEFISHANSTASVGSLDINNNKHQGMCIQTFYTSSKHYRNWDPWRPLSLWNLASWKAIHKSKDPLIIRWDIALRNPCEFRVCSATKRREL